MNQPYRITNHAREEMARRGITEAVLTRVMAEPGQIVAASGGRKAYQSLVEIEGKLYVVRIIVEEADPLAVVTVYRTSKVAKYWSETDESNV